MRSTFLLKLFDWEQKFYRFFWAEMASLKNKIKYECLKNNDTF
jgi:hypothetical protein